MGFLSKLFRRKDGIDDDAWIDLAARAMEDLGQKTAGLQDAIQLGQRE